VRERPLEPEEAPMKYLLLIYGNPRTREFWARCSEAERAEGLEAYAALNRDLAASGELIASEALADPSAGKRVSARGGRTLTTDGPFAEAKEQLAGFFLLECRSLERAIEVAARVPEAEFGLVEVRPVMVYEGMER
jgi:hypothetical protein